MRLNTYIYPLPIISGYALSILLILGIFSCSHKIATEKLPTTHIIFGGGGGFTGVTKDYILLEDGRILAFKKDSATQHIIKRIGKNQAAALYAESDSLHLQTRLYNVPDNMSCYLVFIKDGKEVNKIVWDGGGKDAQVPADIDAFYKKLVALTRKE